MDALEDVRAQVAPLVPDVFGVLLWGSHAAGSGHAGSDVDVCIVAGPQADVADVLRKAWSEAGLAAPRFDVKVFEELPLYLKGEVMERGKLVATRDARALWEYLRPFGKVWRDQSIHRFGGADELARMLEARARERAGG